MYTYIYIYIYITILPFASPLQIFVVNPQTDQQGDLQSYDDCGIVNGITADSFIVPRRLWEIWGIAMGKNMVI